MENSDDRWYFTKEQLANSPSRRAGYEYDRELSCRQHAANFIQDMGQRLHVSQLCINTAIVYMHRFYLFHSMGSFHRNSMAAAALFLAAKVEEQPRKLEHVIKVAHMCLHRENPNLDVKSEAYLEQAQDLVFNENVLLQTLGFDVAIDHPHTHVVRCCHLVRASKDLAQTSYFMASNSLHLTTMCLQYKPTVVACFCIHLACKWSNWDIPRSSEGRDWFWYVDKTVTIEQLEQLTAEFLAIFDKCPTKLKKKMMSMNHSNSPGFSQAIASEGVHFDDTRSSQQSGSRASEGLFPAQKKVQPPEGKSNAQAHPSKVINYRDYREGKERERLEKEKLHRDPHQQKPLPPTNKSHPNIPQRSSTQVLHKNYPSVGAGCSNQQNARDTLLSNSNRDPSQRFTPTPSTAKEQHFIKHGKHPEEYNQNRNTSMSIQQQKLQDAKSRSNPNHSNPYPTFRHSNTMQNEVMPRDSGNIEESFTQSKERTRDLIQPPPVVQQSHPKESSLPSDHRDQPSRERTRPSHGYTDKSNASSAREFLKSFVPSSKQDSNDFDFSSPMKKFDAVCEEDPQLSLLKMDNLDALLNREIDFQSSSLIMNTSDVKKELDLKGDGLDPNDDFGWDFWNKPVSSNSSLPKQKPPKTVEPLQPKLDRNDLKKIEKLHKKPEPSKQNPFIKYDKHAKEEQKQDEDWKMKTIKTDAPSSPKPKPKVTTHPMNLGLSDSTATSSKHPPSLTIPLKPDKQTHQEDSGIKNLPGLGPLQKQKSHEFGAPGSFSSLLPETDGLVNKTTSIFSPDSKVAPQSILNSLESIKSELPSIDTPPTKKVPLTSSLFSPPLPKNTPSTPGQRNRTLSSGSEPELIPLLTKLENTPGYENIIKEKKADISPAKPSKKDEKDKRPSTKEKSDSKRTKTEVEPHKEKVDFVSKDLFKSKHVSETEKSKHTSEIRCDVGAIIMPSVPKAPTVKPSAKPIPKFSLTEPKLSLSSSSTVNLQGIEKLTDPSIPSNKPIPVFTSTIKPIFTPPPNPEPTMSIDHKIVVVQQPKTTHEDSNKIIDVVHKKSEKKKKKEKRKHKEKDKDRDKDRSEKKKEKKKHKSKDKERDKHKEKRKEDKVETPIKITIPKDKIGLTIPNETNSSLKLKIPKEKLKHEEKERPKYEEREKADGGGLKIKISKDMIGQYSNYKEEKHSKKRDRSPYDNDHPPSKSQRTDRK